MNKRQHAHYKKLLEEKISSLGVKDEISFRPTGKVRFTQKTSGPIISPKNATPEQKQKWIEANFNKEPTYIAQNFQRNLVKRMLRMTPEVIEAFLKADLNAVAGAMEAKGAQPPAIAQVGQEESKDVKTE